MKKITFLTSIYVAGIAPLVAIRWGEFQQLSLNELGDFLAGAVGPLALIWLVFGYMQQGEELKQGTKALELQTEELKNSVDQQSKIAVAQEVSLRNYERSLEPLIRLSVNEAGWKDDDFYCAMKVENLGEYCEHVVLKVHYERRRIKPKYIDPLFSGDSALVWINGLDEWDDFDVVVEYVVRSGRRNSQSFAIFTSYDQEDRRHCYLVRKNAFLTVADGS